MPGDIQYKGHASLNNNNLIYWKETKNFDDSCSAHISGSYYVNGNMALPDQATFIIEDSVFGDNVGFEANHHCHVGTTGFLCMPQYVFHNVQWRNTNKNSNWMYFQNGATNYGGIYTLSPASSVEQTQDLVFPAGYISLVSSKYEYLLSTPSCVLSSDLGYGQRYDNGILCQVPLRALKIYSRGLVNDDSAPFLSVATWFNGQGVESQSTMLPSVIQEIPFQEISGTAKQGFSLPVIPGTEQSYKLSLTTGDGNIPDDWVIEFSDPVMGNRWGVEYVQLQLQGRSCGVHGLVSSQHDRRYLFSGFEFMNPNAWGNHGACVVSDSPPQDIPVKDCPNAAGDSDGKHLKVQLFRDVVLLLALFLLCSPCNNYDKFPYRGPRCDGMPRVMFYDNL